MKNRLKIALAGAAACAGLVLATGQAYAALTIGATTLTTDGAFTNDGVASSAFAWGGTVTTGSFVMGNALTTGTITLGGTSMAAGGTTIRGGTATTSIQLIPATNGGVVIGAGAGTGDLIFGSSTAANIVAVGYGTGANVIRIGTAQTAGSISIGTAMTTGTITLGGSMTTGTITLGNGNATTSIAGALAVTGTTTLLGVLTAERASGTVVSNAVTLNTISGKISDGTDLTASSTRAAITLTNSRILAESLILINVCSTPDSGAMIGVSATPAAGSATITVWNASVVQTSVYSLCFLVIN